MKITFITHYTGLYGANRSLLNLITGLQNLKVDIQVITPAQGDITEALAKRNISYSVIPFHNEILYYQDDFSFCRRILLAGKGLLKFVYNRYLVLRYKDVLKDADIIHVNSSATLIGSYFASFLKKPLVWHIREFGWEDYRIRYNFGYQYFNSLLNKASAVISISQAVYAKRGRHASARYNEVIYNGVISKEELRLAQERLHSNKNRGHKALTWGIVGNISPEKNQIEALTAFHLYKRYHPDSTLLIVGTGPEEYIAMLRAYVSSHQLEQSVIFTGFISDTAAIYASIDCLLMCSKNEALGRVTIEAMANGIPVIGYAGGGTLEIVTNGDNGLLYENGPEELSEKMRLIAEDRTLVSKFITNAANSLGNYTIEKSAASVFSIYEKCLQEKL